MSMISSFKKQPYSVLPRCGHRVGKAKAQGIAYNAEELLGGSTKQVQTKTMQAEETLRNLLDKPAPAEGILRRIIAAGISERTLMTAKKNLGVLSEKRGAQWFWRLPNGQGCKDVIH